MTSELSNFEENMLNNGVDELLSVAEIAEKEGVSVRTVYNWIQKTKIRPSGRRINPGTNDSPLFSIETLKRCFRVLTATEHLDKAGLDSFVIGEIERHGTPEQVKELRDIIDRERAPLVIEVGKLTEKVQLLEEKATKYKYNIKRAHRLIDANEEFRLKYTELRAWLKSSGLGIMERFEIMYENNVPQQVLSEEQTEALENYDYQ